MKNILVLCTGNSCRSQIAEGYLKQFAASRANIYSAGTEPHGVNPLAVATMLEDGVDISSHTSNHVDEYQFINFDLVITVCDHANEHCPVFSGKAIKLHHNFPDPAKFIGSEMELKLRFAEVRDMIKSFCKQVVEGYSI